jgi:hypothetical protein
MVMVMDVRGPTAPDVLDFLAVPGSGIKFGAVWASRV